MPKAFRERKSLFARIVLLVLSVLVTGTGLARPAAAQLVNPGFDSGPPGPVGNFGPVVGPPFSPGFWGAEDADIVSATACGTPPRSPQYMLQLNPGGGSHSQAWQAVDVSASPPAMVSLRGWANTCAGGGTTVGVDIRTFNNPNGWPSHTLLVNTSFVLDGDPDTWQQVALNCAVIPADTHWILAQVFMVNATAASRPGYFDDMELRFDECPTPTLPTTWSRVKAVMSADLR